MAVRRPMSEAPKRLSGAQRKKLWNHLEIYVPLNRKTRLPVPPRFVRFLDGTVYGHAGRGMRRIVEEVK